MLCFVINNHIHTINNTFIYIDMHALCSECLPNRLVADRFANE